ncbi:MAG TPA: cell division protein FtsQ/DivIB [Amaricoccus sp.]|nr:cell division protein FtsQ/DivIB [Amaricoccus sp.]
MLPVRTPGPRLPVRRDPAPSRLRYRLNRLWLRQGFRRLVNFGVPMLAGLAAAWTLSSELDLRGRTLAVVEEARAAIVYRPQFVITSVVVPDVSRDLAEAIRVAAFVQLPVSSLELDVNAVRDRVEQLDAVERVRVRALASGVLEIRAAERVPLVVWRSDAGLELLDAGGVRVAEIDSRRRRPDLPLIAGDGADRAVPEALALLAEARPVGARIRGLVRQGERRWDLILDRGQLVKLPAQGAVDALGTVMALEARDELLKRDVSVVDVRDPRRLMLRLNEPAIDELERLRKTAAGEDA